MHDPVKDEFPDMDSSILLPHPLEWCKGRYINLDSSFNTTVADELESLLFYDKVLRPPTLSCQTPSMKDRLGLMYASHMEMALFDLHLCPEMAEDYARYTRPRESFYGISHGLTMDGRLFPLGLYIEIDIEIESKTSRSDTTEYVYSILVSEGWEHTTERIPYAEYSMALSPGQQKALDQNCLVALQAGFSKYLVEKVLKEIHAPEMGRACRDAALTVDIQPGPRMDPGGCDFHFRVLVSGPTNLLEKDVPYGEVEGMDLFQLPAIEMTLLRTISHVYLRLKGGLCGADRLLPSTFDWILDEYVKDQFLLRTKSSNEVAEVREILLDGIGNLSGAIQKGQISERDYERLLVKSEDWRSWLREADDDHRLMSQVIDEICSNPIMEQLPAKSLRWGICTATGVGLDMMGAGGLGTLTAVGISALDTFALSAFGPRRKVRSFCTDIRKVVNSARFPNNQ